MKVELLDSMGSDLTVANAARVSFAKQHDNFASDDARLIGYLAMHKHWTPFAHVVLQFRIKAPLFVARQLAKHQVGGVWNEVSRRYVNTPPEMYLPDEWRTRPENIKQGSAGALDYDTQDEVTKSVMDHFSYANTLYRWMLDQGVCPEQARSVLPQAMETEWWWTGSLAFFARVCQLRLDPHSQAETREIAERIQTLARLVAPVSWQALLSERLS